jgi:hypothetical protein
MRGTRSQVERVLKGIAVLSRAKNPAGAAMLVTTSEISMDASLRSEQRKESIGFHISSQGNADLFFVVHRN